MLLFLYRLDSNILFSTKPLCLLIQLISLSSVRVLCKIDWAVVRHRDTTVVGVTQYSQQMRHKPHYLTEAQHNRLPQMMPAGGDG